MSPQQKAAQEAAGFVDRLNEVILFPLIGLLSGIAFLVFLYGCAVYILNANNDQARNQGKQHIMYGIIGLLVMVSAWAVLSLAANTFGLNKEQSCADDPTQAGCEDVFKIN